MTTTAQDLFVTGLKNAHAMENQALSIMKPQASRIENYPEVEAQIQKHITETEGQIARLERILETLGEDKSSLKDLALSLAGSDPARRTWILERLAAAKAAKVKRKDLQDWLERELESYD